MNPFLPDPPVADRCAPASPIDTAQVLEDAADLLLIHGRCIGRRINRAGEHCVVGAIVEIEQGHVRGLASLSPAVTAVAEHWRLPTFVGVTQWNDDPATTDDEVRDTLLLVAKELRGQAVAS